MVIGDDSVSSRWLISHREKLQMRREQQDRLTRPSVLFLANLLTLSNRELYEYTAEVAETPQ